MYNNTVSVIDRTFISLQDAFNAKQTPEQIQLYTQNTANMWIENKLDPECFINNFNWLSQKSANIWCGLIMHVYFQKLFEMSFQWTYELNEFVTNYAWRVFFVVFFNWLSIWYLLFCLCRTQTKEMNLSEEINILYFTFYIFEKGLNIFMVCENIILLILNTFKKNKICLHICQNWPSKGARAQQNFFVTFCCAFQKYIIKIFWR